MTIRTTLALGSSLVLLAVAACGSSDTNGGPAPTTAGSAGSTITAGAAGNTNAAGAVSGGSAGSTSAGASGFVAAGSGGSVAGSGGSSAGGGGDDGGAGGDGNTGTLACADLVSGGALESATWDPTQTDADFATPDGAAAYDALNTCACVTTIAAGGCADKCAMAQNGTSTPNFCDGVGALLQCGSCLHTTCGSQIADCASN